MASSIWASVFLSFLATVCALPESQFYPFGIEHGDTAMARNDDGSSSEVRVSTLFPFFNRQHRSLWVNTNGIISLDINVGTYTPRPFPIINSSLIAPFWADVNTGINGTIFYRESTNETMLAQVTDEISPVFRGEDFRASWMFIATWKDVAFYGARGAGQDKRNTFQAVLATNGRHSYAIFNYAKIEWTTGTASGGNRTTGLGGTPAQVGFNAGYGNASESIKASLTDEILNVTKMSNCGQEGKFIFGIDRAVITSAGGHSEGFLTVTPRFGSMLGGEEVFISGPKFVQTKGRNQLHKQDVAVVTFTKGHHKEEVECSHVTDYKASCITPTMFVTGYVDVSLKRGPRHNMREGDNFHGHFTYENIANVAPRVQRVSPDQWAYKQDTSQTYFELMWHSASVKDYLQCVSDEVRLDLFKITVYETGQTPTLDHVIILTDGGISVNSGSHTLHRPFDEYKGTDFITGVIRMSCNEEAAIVLTNVRAVWSDVHSLIWASPVKPEHIDTFCKKWIDKEEKLEKSYIDRLMHCPCNVRQADLDITFDPDPICNRNSGVRHNNCGYHSGAVHCVTSNASRTERDDTGTHGGHTCCYDNSGNLLERDVDKGTRKRVAGRSSRYYYLGEDQQQQPGQYPFISNFMGDELPYKYCCEYTLHNGKSENCNRYLELRPALTDCEKYVPTLPAWMSGDPHMVTLDGARYTFNGLGEYTVVETLDQSFVMQARTERARDSDGNLQQASIFSAVVMKGNHTDCIQVQLNEITTSEILVNGERQDFENQPSQDFNGVSITSVNDSDVTVKFRTLGIGVVMEITADMINIRFHGSDSMKKNTRGLLGPWNDDVTDDFTCANGTILPQGIPSRQVHEFGESWRVDRISSLFKYDVGKDYTTFNSNPNFEPVFVEELTSAGSVTDEQRGICGSSTECLYDLLTTNNTAIAKSTRHTETVYEEVIKTLKEVIVRCPVLPALQHGDKDIGGHKPGDVVKYTCDENYTLEGPSSRTCLVTGSWDGIGGSFCKETGISVAKIPEPSGLSTLAVALIAVFSGSFALLVLTGLVCLVCRNKKTKTAKVSSSIKAKGRNNPIFESANSHTIPDSRRKEAWPDQTEVGRNKNRKSLEFV